MGISPWRSDIGMRCVPDRCFKTDRSQMPLQELQTLEAVKEIYEQAPYAGIACAMKNAGVGVGLPDWGRCRLLVQNKMVQTIAELPVSVRTWNSPDTGFADVRFRWSRFGTVLQTHPILGFGTTSGSRQTLITGEAAKRTPACEKL